MLRKSTDNDFNKLKLSLIIIPIMAIVIGVKERRGQNPTSVTLTINK